MGGGGHVDRVKLKPRNLLKKGCDRLGSWVVTEKAQYMFFFFLKLKIAVFGLFSIMAQFGCLVSDGEP